MSAQNAKAFFDKLDNGDANLKASVKQKLEDIAKDAKYPATLQELSDELKKRWQASPSSNSKVVYSEPPGF